VLDYPIFVKNLFFLGFDLFFRFTFLCPKQQRKVTKENAFLRRCFSSTKKRAARAAHP
jgi:hypothetical protein